MKTIALIPARSGSKGFAHKNRAKIRGKTLMELAITVGQDCDRIERVYISTDSPDYEKIAIQAGASSLGLRPAGLASDSAKTCDLAIDFLKGLDKLPDYLVVLQPTSPMRSPQDISAMIDLVETHKAHAAVSMERLEEPHPSKLKRLTQRGYIAPFLPGTSSEVPRQSLEPVYKLNGAIYLIQVPVLLSQKTFLPEKTLPYHMKGSINIDSEMDYQMLLGLLERDIIHIYGV